LQNWTKLRKTQPNWLAKDTGSAFSRSRSRRAMTLSEISDYLHAEEPVPVEFLQNCLGLGFLVNEAINL
jgi:hypothetical protein